MNHKGTKDTEEDRRPKKKEDASQLTIDHHLFYFLIFNYLLPITDYPLPITHYRLPITDYPLPNTLTFRLGKSSFE